MDYVEIDRGYALVKVPAAGRFLGVPLSELRIRATEGVTVAAVKSGDDAWRNAMNDTVLVAGDTLLVLGPTPRVEAFAQLR